MTKEDNETISQVELDEYYLLLDEVKKEEEELERQVSSSSFICPICAREPCLWTQIEPTIYREMVFWAHPFAKKSDVANRRLRYKMYGFVYWLLVEWDEIPNRGKREQLPLCITTGIRSIAPDSMTKYTSATESKVVSK